MPLRVSWLGVTKCHRASFPGRVRHQSGRAKVFEVREGHSARAGSVPLAVDSEHAGSFDLQGFDEHGFN